MKYAWMRMVWTKSTKKRKTVEKDTKHFKPFTVKIERERKRSWLGGKERKEEFVSIHRWWWWWRRRRRRRRDSGSQRNIYKKKKHFDLFGRRHRNFLDGFCFLFSIFSFFHSRHFVCDCLEHSISLDHFDHLTLFTCSVDSDCFICATSTFHFDFYLIELIVVSDHLILMLANRNRDRVKEDGVQRNKRRKEKTKTK